MGIPPPTLYNSLSALLGKIEKSNLFDKYDYILQNNVG